MSEISEYLRAAKDALEVLKGLLGFLPQGRDSDKARDQIDRAEKALKASEAQLAKALGYHLCRCTFPPQIMLWQKPSQMFACQNCGHELDPNRRGRFAPSRLIQARR